MRRLFEKYRKLSYRKKVFAGMIVAAVIPTVLCFIGVLLTFRIANSNKLYNEAEEALNSANRVMQEACTDIKQALYQLADAPATVRMLEDNDITNLYSVYRMLYSSVIESNRHADFSVYDIDGKLKLYNGEKSCIKENLSVNWGILFELKKNPYEVQVRGGRIYSGSEKDVMLRIGQTVLDAEGKAVGFVVAHFTNQHFTDSFRSFELNRMGEIYILDDFGELVFTSSIAQSDDYQEAYLAMFSAEDMDFFKSKDGGYRYYYIYNEENQLHLMYRQQVEPYVGMSKSLLLILTVATVVSFSLSLLVSRSLSHMFYRPIRRMSEGMKQIKHGDFSVKIEVESDDELGRLSGMFNEMSSRLTDNMNKLVNREKELANANIKMMQAQLNPHFIYNTLDTMKWIAKDNEIPEVATLSSGLAEIMRASISSGQTVKLKKELELVESYVAIQQIRFADKFEFITDIPDELLECEVPKLILQPIVENAILHGFKNRDYGRVLITGYRYRSNLLLRVKDDGTGIDEKTAEKLNNHIHLERGSNIGFGNVDSIIRLHYGDGYGLHISRDAKGGTEVLYTLPYVQSIVEEQ